MHNSKRKSLNNSACLSHVKPKAVNASFLLLVAMCVMLVSPGCWACSGYTCAECISSGANCAWCADNNFAKQTEREKRCGIPADLRSANCTDIQNPISYEDISFRRDEQVRDGENVDGSDAIQLQPQRMHIRLRPQKEFQFTATFRLANNFPVDLYFLFDVSATMQESLADLSKFANQIADEIRSISLNYKMGYGTFQDKVLLPFTNTHPIRLNNPCTTQSPCAPAFAFRHVLALSQEINTFKEAVKNTSTTGNIDQPEGGLDAMMQVITCKKEVGWRDNSRQIIIFASDARMHFAGDGKLAGLIAPNDRTCHLNGNKTNPMSSILDYPSVGQIASALDETKQYVIFAVTNPVLPVYNDLGKQVPRSVVSELKSGDRSNVVDIIRTKYRELVNGFQIRIKTTSDNIKVTTSTQYCRRFSQENNVINCNDIEIGQAIIFQVSIQAEKCPEKSSDRFQNITLEPTDFRFDKLDITLELLCNCNCENASKTASAPKAAECTNGNGTLECGVCSCNQGRFGSACECSAKETGQGVSYSTCSEGDNATAGAQECRGVGECFCGVCKCQQGYSGRFCECNDRTCKDLNGLVCGGNGQCQCGKCQCSANFTGQTCECPLSTDTCILRTNETSEKNLEVCSGHGSCRCGKCTCDEGYRGLFCEHCIICGGKLCDIDQYVKCARCKADKKYTEECPTECPPVEIVQEVDDPGACPHKLEGGCLLQLAVITSGKNTTIYVQQDPEKKQPFLVLPESTGLLFKYRYDHGRHKKYLPQCVSVRNTLHSIDVYWQVCPQEIDMLLVVGGIIGGVVAVGLLLLLLWKLLTFFFDKMEYARFMREIESYKWAKQDNPLYKGAVTTFRNPTVDTSNSKEDLTASDT